jgi:metallophosphoesterase superfamily enzyme
MGKVQFRPRLTEAQYHRFLELEKNSNVLVIGDLHAPFIRKGYLEHCVAIRDKYSCDEIVLIGDIVDNHYSSFHTADPDGYGAGEELDRAVDMLQPWIEEFPLANVMLGNHDRIPYRKAMDAGLSYKWIKGYSEMIGAPGWEFMDHYEKNGVLYVHGDGAGHAAVRAKKDLCSVVQGHFHSKAYAEFLVGRNYKIFGMQVGCGLDETSYAMAYGKNGPRMAMACGVVLNNGKQPIIEMMDL